MSTFTENYDFIKPSAEDPYDIQDFNENMDTLDALLAENETAMEQVNGKIGNAEDNDTSTVFGKLNQMASGTKEGLTAIKSIQHLNISNSFSGDKAIQRVNPQNCIVYFMRLYDNTNNSSGLLTYTLKETALSITIANNMQVDFWIIEFC